MSVSEPVLSLYLEWLSDLIDASETDYQQLLEYLFEQSFEWSIRNDENRAADGKDLRDRFLDECVGDAYDRIEFEDWSDNTPCTLLEMMIALCIGIEDDLMYRPDRGFQPGTWFWMMIENAGLSEASDDEWDEQYVAETIQRVLGRTYDRNGVGGFWPLRQRPKKDQRHVELWYQASTYLMENGYC